MQSKNVNEKRWNKMAPENNDLLKLQTLKLLEVVDLKEKNDMLFELNLGLLQRLIKTYSDMGLTLDIETKSMISEIRLILAKIGTEHILD